MYKTALYLEDFFQNGMDRIIPYFNSDLNTEHSVVLNLGCGKKIIEGAVNLDYPEWDAETDPIDFPDNSVGQIHAYHFFEHLSDPRKMLAECQRVLEPGGLLNIVVPYYSSNIACQDLDHKAFFTEETWKILFSNPYYDKNRNGTDWDFEIGTNVIMGIAERNVVLLTQLIKKGE